MDVTTIIGAEDFILSQNRDSEPEDPFARQCFVELIQSLIFMSNVFVAHPTMLSPSEDDFGARPRLLRSLMSAGILTPLRLRNGDGANAVAESEALRILRGPEGTHSIVEFVRQAAALDDYASTPSGSLGRRIVDWSDFQDRNVRTSGNHEQRISTSDGIEDDAFGDWARSAGGFFAGTFEEVMAIGTTRHLMAVLARGVKYEAKASVAGVAYQAHPMRRDFLLTLNLHWQGAQDALVYEVIKAVRGVYESLADSAGLSSEHRLKLLELELPLLGGRLWSSSDTGQLSDGAWIDFVVQRISEYREDSLELREAVETCVSQEDYLRIARDIDGARQRLLERLGLQAVNMSPLERELVDGVASVAEAWPGVPKVSGLWVGARMVSSRLKPGNPVQRFLYREFLNAWKRTGH